MYLCKSISGYYLILCKRGCNQCWIMMGVLWIIDFICNLSGMASWLTLVFGTCNNHFTPNIYKHHYKTLNTMYKIQNNQNILWYNEKILNIFINMNQYIDPIQLVFLPKIKVCLTEEINDQILSDIYKCLQHKYRTKDD